MPLLDKREVFEELLEEAEPTEKVQVTFSKRHPGVKIPPGLRETYEGGVTFDYGYHLAKPIPDLQTDDTAIYATLSFGGRASRTIVPWEAVRLITLGRAEDDVRQIVVWPNLHDFHGDAPKKPAHLRVVK